MVKRILSKIINALVDHTVSIIDYRADFTKVDIVEQASSLNIGFRKIHSTALRENPSFKKTLPLDPLFTKSSEGEIVGNGIIINRQGEILLESTIFQKEYLDKLNQKHLILFRRFLPRRRIAGVMISLSTILENNYYHWVLESLTRMMLVERLLTHEEVFIVVDDAPGKVKEESLGFLFELPADKILKKKTKEVFVGKLVLPSFTHTRNEMTSWVDICHPHVIKKINARVREKMAKVVGKKSWPKKFILSRRDAATRRILNEDFLLNALPEDFSLVDIATLSFADQVSLFFNAEIVISTHGAGLTNIIFGQKLMIIELFPINRKVIDQMVFTQLSEALKYEHYVFTYSPCNNQQDLEIDQLLVDKIISLPLGKPTHD